MLSAYPACFIKEDSGYSIIFPDLDIATCGDTLDWCFFYGSWLSGRFLYSANLGGEHISPASSLNDINIDKVMQELDVTSDEAFVNIVTVDVAEYAKSHFTKSVRKNLTIPSWLNDAAIKQNINFSQVLQEALLSKIQSHWTIPFHFLYNTSSLKQAISLASPPSIYPKNRPPGREKQ